MKRSNFWMLLGLFLSFVATSQAQDTLDVNQHADCASLLTIQTNKTVGPTTAPVGHGNDLEFEGNSRESLHFMEQENNSVWYQFTAKTKGNLTFEIEPLDSLNDYDFALYKYTGDDFCAAVKNKSLLPIRTNFSRNQPSIGSRTGLKNLAEKEFVASGINPAYSQSVPVNSKEIYVLVVNNVYDNGAGHLLHFDYSVNLNLTGEVFDVEGKGSLEANVTLTNTKTGDVVAETTSDSMTGAYKLVFDMPKSQLNDPLHLEISKDGYFFFDTIVTGFKIVTKMRDVKLKTKIKKLKKGDKFVVANILFYGDSPKPLPRSLPSIKALYKTMKRNKTLKISIEGHTNGCNRGEDYSMNLSNARAATVVKFLEENDIAKDRMSFVGYGCQFVLHNISGRFAHLNRRVEIEIVDL